jgi:L-ribulose-5-phosphate 4-epimerase
MDEGYIKFNCQWIKAAPPPPASLVEINAWRSKLYGLGLIGAYPNGIGFGNVSIRAQANSFIITGSATGVFETLDETHFVLVTDYDLVNNRLTCHGPIAASSESLSHAVIYECSPETNCVIHIHNLEMWRRLLGKVPTTSETVPYGTPEMAEEIRRLFLETDVAEEKFLVMGGHEEGIISFGKNPTEAGEILLRRLPNPC